MSEFDNGITYKNPNQDFYTAGIDRENHRYVNVIECYGVSHESATALRDRVLACVNACDGIPTECLTGGLEVPFMTQRDELLEALKDAYPHIANDGLRARIGNLIAITDGVAL